VTKRQARGHTTTPDETDKEIGFILEMQAQFETNIGKLESNLVRSEVNIDSLRVSVADFRVSVGDLAGVVRESVKISDDRLTWLDD
jgi:hypothetical protein